jgi:hypothetical protein
MKVVEAPSYAPRADLFLAGGITGAENWQKAAIGLLEPLEGTIYNPRRSEPFQEEDAELQVEWEYEALRVSDAILFWFPPQTLCPITLFELGTWSVQQGTPIFVGTHPGYKRRFDVVKQLSLVRPGLRVHDQLESVVSEYVQHGN